MRIDEIMTAAVVTCRGEQTGADAARIMWDRDCGCVPIVDGDGHPVGMVTDRDLCMAAYTRGVPLHDIRLDTVMSRAVRSCRRADSVDDAERTMAEAQVRRLPVIEHELLVGIVSPATSPARDTARCPVA